MKKLITFLILFAVTLTSFSQSLGYQDLALLFSENDANGTARFTSMSGAFGALGGDISSININPAGIAVFNNSAFSGSFNSRNTDITSNYYGTSRNNQNQFFNLTQAGAVLVFRSAYNSEWEKFAIGFNYRMKKDYNNGFSAVGNSGIATFRDFPLDNNTPTIDYNVAEEQRFRNNYTGELNEVSVAFSAVHQNKLYVGGGLNFYDLNFRQRATLTEFNNDGNGNTLDAILYQENLTAGSGVSLNAGFIYKASKNFRFGLSYQTPTWFTEIVQDVNYAFDNSNYIDGDFANGDIDYFTQDEEFFERLGFQINNYRLKTPSKLTASAALIFGKSGLLSVDYSNKNFTNMNLSDADFSGENQFFQNELRNVYALNIGTEWRFDRFSVRGGYKFEQDPLKTALDSDNLEGYSFGGGYNFGNFKIDFSYSDNNRTAFYNSYPQFPSVNSTELAISNKVFTGTVTINL